MLTIFENDTNLDEAVLAHTQDNGSDFKSTW